jgi:hypothetical protein
MLYVDNVLGRVADWQQIFASEQTAGLVDLQSIASSIQTEIDTVQNADSSNDGADSEVEAIIGESIWVGSSLAQVSGQEEFADASAVAASVFDLMGDISADSGGAPSNAPFSGKVADVGSALHDKLADTQKTLGRLGEIMVGDWGKLQAADAQVNDAWAWDTSDADALADTIKRTANAEIYRSLLPVYFGVYVVDVPYLNQSQNGHKPNPFELICDIDNTSADHPLGDGADNESSWITMPVGFGEQGTDATATIDWFGLTFPTGSSDVSPGGVTHRAQSVPGDWTSNFFQPVSSGNDSLLGLDAVEFFADDRFDRRWFYCSD